METCFFLLVDCLGSTFGGNLGGSTRHDEPKQQCHGEKLGGDEATTNTVASSMANRTAATPNKERIKAKKRRKSYLRERGKAVSGVKTQAPRTRRGSGVKTRRSCPKRLRPRFAPHLHPAHPSRVRVGRRYIANMEVYLMIDL